MKTLPCLTLLLLALAVSTLASVAAQERDPIFGQSVNYDVGQHVRDVMMSDLDGDSHLDIVTVCWVDNAFWVFLGDGEGGFAPGVRYPVSEGPYAGEVGDVNGDLIPDVVTANVDSDDIAVFLGLGDGTFGPPAHSPTVEFPRGLALGDLDGDLDLDAIVSPPLAILMGNGDGTFQAPLPLPLPELPGDLTLLHLDADADLDLIAVHSSADAFSVMLGDGSGSFLEPMLYGVGVWPQRAALADLDHDGDLDIAVTGGEIEQDGHVAVLMGSAYGTFGPPVFHTTGWEPHGIAVEDFDRDGHADICTANYWSIEISVLRGDGDGGFSAHEDYVAGPCPHSLAAGDFDHDLDFDLFVGNSEDDFVTVLTNLTSEPGATPEPAGAGSRALRLRATNPSLSAPIISFTLDAPADVDLSVLDLSGRIVARLWGGPLRSGEHSFVWRPGDGPGGASGSVAMVARGSAGPESGTRLRAGAAGLGIYFCRLRADGQETGTKLVLIP